MITFRINREERLLSMRFAGEISVADIRSMLQAMVTECPDVVAFDSIADARPEHSFLSADDVRALVEIAKRAGVQEHASRAVVLTADPARFGMSRMFELLAERESKVERLTTESLGDAAKWLHRSEELIQSELALLAGSETEQADR